MALCYLPYLVELSIAALQNHVPNVGPLWADHVSKGEDGSQLCKGSFLRQTASPQTQKAPRTMAGRFRSQSRGKRLQHPDARLKIGNNQLAGPGRAISADGVFQAPRLQNRTPRRLRGTQDSH